jgi:nicotinate-nucleotide adenylyltransferase
MRIGILGATFDPVHLGHMAIAAEARRSLGLSEVLFIPAGQPQLKTSISITPSRHRVEMVRLAIAGMQAYKISEIEVKRPGASYAVDTLAEIRHAYAGNDELYFILGWDSLEKFPKWREPLRILEMCILAVVPRPGWPHPNLKALERAVPVISNRIVLLEGPQIDISSTAIRQLVFEGKEIDNLVPAPVAAYIRKHNLYKKHQEV